MKNKPHSGNSDDSEFLMRLLFDAYYWFDESLQRSMQAQNIPPLSRSQSMVMICLVEGISRPSALARKLRVSRQAMQKTLADLEGKGYLCLEPDPADKRAKHVRLSKIGQQRQNSARVYLRNLEQALRTRLGAHQVAALSDALQADWGDPSAVETE